MNMPNYIASLQKKGQLFFTLQELKQALGKSKNSLYISIYHLKKKGVICSPMKGFYVIVPIEHRAIGSLPPQELVVLLMDHHIKAPYYVGLLTAAKYHGATHQRVSAFQVVSSKRFYKSINVGEVWIEFVYKQNVSQTQVEKKVVRTGYLPISTPEETIKDIMTYHVKSGGVNHQATVLGELVESLRPKELLHLMKKSTTFLWIQRMGYILEHIDTFYTKERDRILAILSSFLLKNKIKYVPLSPSIKTKGFPKNLTWKIIENATVESDI